MNSSLTPAKHVSAELTTSQPTALMPSALMQGLRSAGIVLVGSALVAVSAHVSIPLWFTPVPITLQPFAVIVLGMLLSPRMAFATMVAYLAEGASGLPVFTPIGPGGLLQLFGPTGGYLLSYPVVAPIVSAWWRIQPRSASSRSFTRGLIVAGAGSLITLAMGALWLGVARSILPISVLKLAVLPFLPGDVLKVCAAAAIAAGSSRWQTRNSAK
jgi:biotin transport system substrate-specific component